MTCKGVIKSTFLTNSDLYVIHIEDYFFYGHLYIKNLWTSNYQLLDHDPMDGIVEQ